MPETPASIPADDSLEVIAAEVMKCTKCPLSQTRTLAVPGEGPSDAEVMIVGEGPGRNEDLQGRPFVGAAGRQLDSLLKEANLNRGVVFITNVVKCRPPENRRPTSSEADACQPYLERQLEILRPKVIVLLGDTALKRFLKDKGLGEVHGKLQQRQGRYSLFPTYHPAAMIYNESLKEVTKNDFRQLGNVLAELPPEG
jgi:uracil-DNA glycosylase family 4